jgi:hypothetical protein
MVKQAVIAFFFAVCALQCTTAYAQLIPVNDLDTAHVYTDLKDALEKRNGVLRLDLSRQKLYEFPTEIFEFTNLQELKLNGKGLTYLLTNGTRIDTGLSVIKRKSFGLTSSLSCFLSAQKR